MTPVRTKADLARRVRAFGFLPFFKNAVPGFSLEEAVDPGVWFTDREGPWEWKGQLLAEGACLYGKFLRGKAVFVCPDCFPDLANLRRGGRTWEEWEDEGLAPQPDRLLMRWLLAHPRAESRRARREAGVSRGYDAALTRLEMQTFVVTCGFQYSVSRDGTPYGWGNAVLEPAERLLPEDALFPPSPRTPEESRARLVARIREALPQADEEALGRILG